MNVQILSEFVMSRRTTPRVAVPLPAATAAAARYLLPAPLPLTLLLQLLPLLTPLQFWDPTTHGK